jgi:hypothetical protein
MTEFTKTKIHFALALLGSLFALHPFLERYQNLGFLYLGYELKWVYAYGATAAALALCVYCFGLTMLSERSHSWLERLGNDFYALAVMIGPLFGGIYLSSLLADLMGQSHLAWAAPAAALGMGIGWLILSQVVGLFLRRRLLKQDMGAKVKQLAEQELAAVNRSGELSASEHLDMSVMESWRAVEARIRRVLLARGIVPRKPSPDALIAAAKRAGIVNPQGLALLEELKQALAVAVSNEPITKAAAGAAQSAGRQILAQIAVGNAANPTLQS